MNTRYIIPACTAVSLVTAMLFTGCRQPPPTIAVIPRTTGTLLWEPMHMGVVDTARPNGLHVYWNAPADEGDVEKQLGFLSAANASEYKGLIFVPDETIADRSLVVQQVNQHRPVVVVDDQLGPPAGPFLSYVSTDEQAGAKLAANRLAKLLHGAGTIAVIGISQRLGSGVVREESFEQQLAAIAPNIHIDLRRYGDSVVTHQQLIAQEILSAPRHYDAIVALSATATLGVYFAKLAADSPGNVQIIGFDQGMLLPLQSGDVDSIVIQNTRKIGQLAMQNIIAQLHGQPVPGTTLVAPLLLTRDTINTPEFISLGGFSHYLWSDQ
jgi:ribose transport system substrate-binding protein